VSEEDDRLRDEAAAWVLGALDNTEAAEFVRRMEASPEVRKEVGELQEAADALPFSVPPVGPPPELRDRIMAVVESEAELLHATGARADRPYRAARTPWWRSLLRPLPVAATACVLLLAGVAAGLLIGGGGSESARTVAAQVTGGGTANASAQVEIDDDHAELVVDGMQSPGAGRVYQVWYVQEGQTDPVPAGALFDVDSAGQGAAALPGGVDDVKSVLVSVEPAGGSEKPTTQPVIAANLS
jgi:anti-sigma-K factor RskA